MLFDVGVCSQIGCLRGNAEGIHENIAGDQPVPCEICSCVRRTEFGNLHKTQAVVSSSVLSESIMHGNEGCSVRLRA